MTGNTTKTSFLNNFYSNPRYSVLLIALLLAAGLSGLSVLPSREDPEITLRNATVLTQFPGASAERVESLVSRVIEDKLREIPEIKMISSRSKSGLSAISIELDDYVYSSQADLLWSEVRNKLKDIEYKMPRGSLMPQLDTTRGNAYTYIVALSMKDSHSAEKNTAMQANDIILLNRYAKELNSHFVNVYGTEFVKNYGEPKEEITVALNANASQSLGLNAAQISQLIAASDAKISAGIINNQQQTMTLEVQGALDSIERIRKIPVSFSKSETGYTTQLGDIATITRGINTPQKNITLINGRYGIVVAARMQANQQGGRWRDDIVQEIEKFKHDLPAQIQLETLFEQQRYTDERLGSLLNNVITGFVLIIAILLLTLGWRSALIVSISLPLTFLFALAAMRFNGLPIHQMSVTGLIVALGILVDNAIVMTDTINRNMRKGQAAIEAVGQAVKHLWLPLLGSTLTTILTFMPLVLMPGASGEFIGGIALAVIFSLVGSYIISHTLVASLSGQFLAAAYKSDEENDESSFLQQGLSFPRLGKAFNKTILFAIHRPKVTIALVLLFPLLGFVGASKLPEQFFPPSDRDMLNFELYMPMSSSSENTLSTVKSIQKKLAENKNIKRADWFIGQSSPSFYYNLPERQDDNPFYAQAMLSFYSIEQANEAIEDLQIQLDHEFPHAQIILRKLEQGPLSFSPVEIRLTGPNIEQLKTYGEQLKTLALSTQDVTHVRASLNDPVAKVWLDVDEQAAALQGLALTDISSQFQSASSGLINGSVLEGSEQLNIRVKSQGIESANSSYLNDMLLTTPNNNNGLPFSSLGHIQVQSSQGVITRRNGQRINTLEIYIRSGVLPATVLTRLSHAIEQSGIELPPGYAYAFGGEDENREKAVGNLMASVGLVVILLVVTVVLAFNSFRLSFIVLCVSIVAAGLGLLSLTVSGFPFGFTSIIGLMGLIGLAINAAIVILSELKASADAMRGDKQAILDSVTSCSRHISSTTITTVMGFMPLILSGGGFWPPFAIVIAGGTVLTTLVSFYFVPAMFALQRK
ncbi:MAG: efflux RND transporter permease subunit [Sinobacterium sp.]|nr:efflux RND transporter permease subunit [Sinobacterium sp.]